MQNLRHSIPKKIILIGASTGGPGQIESIITALPKLRHTTVIIAQHMVEGFMQSFAKRLQVCSANPISVIEDGQSFNEAKIYISEAQTLLKPFENGYRFQKKSLDTYGYNPNINLLFNSFSDLCIKHEIMCVILTGIGDDGVTACQRLSLKGASCLTELAESAVVDGMPNRARALVSDIGIDTLENIVNKICEFSE